MRKQRHCKTVSKSGGSSAGTDENLQPTWRLEYCSGVLCCPSFQLVLPLLRTSLHITFRACRVQCKFMRGFLKTTRSLLGYPFNVRLQMRTGISTGTTTCATPCMFQPFVQRPPENLKSAVSMDQTYVYTDVQNLLRALHKVCVHRYTHTRFVCPLPLGLRQLVHRG